MQRMTAIFQRVGLIGKHGDPSVKDRVLGLGELLQQRGHRVLLEEQTAQLLNSHRPATAPLPIIARDSDLVIVVGGDGTLLHTARALAAHNVPLVGVNLGRLGFLTDVSPDYMLESLEQILAGEFEEEQRFLLQASIGSDGEPGKPQVALNDVVLHKWNIARMIEFETHVDGRFVGSQRSDGLIVSTPTGSTAYALSGGGPLMTPELNAMVLVPICPHTLSNRPIVIGGDSRVEIRICPAHHDHVRVTCDGQTNMPVGRDQTLRIRKAEHSIRLIHPRGHDHFDILRAKLGWGGRPK
jgi:NAD+ kinase